MLIFDVIDTDCLLSDGHALLSWFISTSFDNLSANVSEEDESLPFKKWYPKLADKFLNNASLNKLNDLHLSLENFKYSINHTTSQIADIFTRAAKQTFPLIKPYKVSKSANAYFGSNVARLENIITLLEKCTINPN